MSVRKSWGRIGCQCACRPRPLTLDKLTALPHDIYILPVMSGPRRAWSKAPCEARDPPRGIRKFAVRQVNKCYYVSTAHGAAVRVSATDSFGEHDGDEAGASADSDGTPKPAELGRSTEHF